MYVQWLGLGENVVLQTDIKMFVLKVKLGWLRSAGNLRDRATINDQNIFV